MRAHVALAVLLAGLAGAAPASATVPGGNGRIAFTSSRDDVSDIFTMNSDGSDQVNLTPGGGNDTDAAPAWDPSGLSLAFMRHQPPEFGLYLMAADGSRQVPVPGTGFLDRDPTWSPDGERITFARNGDLYSFEPDGSMRPLTTGANNDLNPAWSPAGAKIAFERQTAFTDADIYVMNPDGSGLQDLSQDPRGEDDPVLHDFNPSWSPDGTKIAFVSTRTPGDIDIWVMNADGTGKRRLTANLVHDDQPEWSPDGEKIAFTSYRDSNWDIYVMNADGSGQTRLTTHPAQDGAPSWQPVPDSDGDGLLDVWEREGVEVDGTLLDLPALGADPLRKDVFVELDWMAGHKLRRAALDIVVDAFANAPVANPDGTTGIDLHVEEGAQIAHQGTLGGPDTASVWAAFDAIKSANFAAERAPAFHYALSAHSHGRNRRSSGLARGIPGADFIVSLGTACPGGGECSGTTWQQAGTFMHEVGHTLGLRHGGDSDTGYKPNYLSIMNYHFQFSGLPTAAGEVFDYSRWGASALPVLDESALMESSAFAPFAPELSEHRTQTRCPDGTTEKVWRIGAAAVDWNCDGTIDGAPVSVDVNDNGALGAMAPFDDWAAITLDGGAIGDLAGAPTGFTEIDEPDSAELVESAQAFTGDTQSPVVTLTRTGPGTATVTATDDRGIDALAITADGASRDVNGAGQTSLTEQVAFANEVTVAALDLTGNASEPATLRDQPPPAPPPPGTPPPPAPQAADTTAPRLAGLSRKRRRIRFRVSEPATVRIAIQRRCPKRARRCLKRRLTRTATAGLNTVKLPKLAPGRYRIRIAATDTAGNRSPARTLALKIRR